MLILLLGWACGLDDPDLGDGADPIACECDPLDTGPTGTTGTTGTTQDSGNSGDTATTGA